MKFRSIAACAALAFTMLAAGSRPAAAGTISVGTFDPSTSPFVVPVDITGAVELVTWQFDLAFDPTVVQIHELCDPFVDAFCDLLTGPVTEGPFTAGPFSLFVPGVIDNVNGLLSLVAGGYGDPPPGPSGDGTLANVLFLSVGEGDPNIRRLTGGARRDREPARMITRMEVTWSRATRTAHRGERGAARRHLSLP